MDVSSYEAGKNCRWKLQTMLWNDK